jgi:uncharacterized membrane protein (UPF0127 family)
LAALRLIPAARLLRPLGRSLALLALAACRPAAAPGLEPIVIKGQTFHLEVAAEPAARARGLMERQELKPDGGMLFIFPEPAPQAYWMGNCRIDIDIIFLDGRGRVTAAHRMKAEAPRRPEESEAQYDARMPRYPSGYPAQFAIELPAGSIDRLGLRVDDRIDLDLDRLKRLAR